MEESIRDPQMGLMSWDDSCEWWEGKVTLPPDFAYTLYVHTPSEDDQSISDEAHQVFEQLRELESQARDFAADELLSIHNESWSEGKPIDRQEFIRRLVPEAIQIFPNGNAEIAFGDDDLFWGHSIGVRYRGRKFTEAVVQG